MERTLKALANANRLRLLKTLQEPQRIGDINLRASPGRGEAWGAPERPMSRQGVRNHVLALADIGVVVRRGEEGEESYVVNHAKLYELTEQLREVATVRPRIEVQDRTMERDTTGVPARVPGPQLVLVRGVREGQVFPLQPPGPDDGWLVGRARTADVPLDFDPYVSSAHCRVVLKEGAHYLVDLPSATNATALNWQPMVRGGVAPLESGDLIGAGMSLLMYRGERSVRGAAAP